MPGGSTYQGKSANRSEELSQYVFSVAFNFEPDTGYDYEVVYVTIGNPAFCLPLYLTGIHFRGNLQHVSVT